MKCNIRKDNKGMTLVEVMAAITILAVVTIPFLNSFLASARSNQKAGTLLRATTVAQNLMESVEAFSLEEICTQMNQEVTASKLYLPDGYEAHYELENVTGEKSGKIVDGKYEFVETNSNTYCFAIQGIQEGEQKYDARIVIDASGYRKNHENSQWTYNDNYSLDVNVMNENTDVIFSVSQEDEARILEDAGWNLADDWENIKRTFSISVAQDEENDKSEIVSITLDYCHKDSLLYPNNVQGKSISRTVSDLKNVYIMYYPNYASTETDILDCFDIELKQKEKFNLGLIKQKYSNSKSEEYYTALLEVTDTQSLTADNVPRINLRTNICRNLYEESVALRQSALKFYYINGNILSNEEAKKRMGFVDGVVQSLVGQVKNSRPIFKTTIQIFPSGTCNGNDSSNFEITEPLAQLTNE